MNFLSQATTTGEITVKCLVWYHRSSFIGSWIHEKKNKRPEIISACICATQQHGKTTHMLAVNLVGVCWVITLLCRAGRYSGARHTKTDELESLGHLPPAMAHVVN